jgi:hypothetical protein
LIGNTKAPIIREEPSTMRFEISLVVGTLLVATAQRSVIARDNNNHGEDGFSKICCSAGSGCEEYDEYLTSPPWVVLDKFLVSAHAFTGYSGYLGSLDQPRFSFG